MFQVLFPKIFDDNGEEETHKKQVLLEEEWERRKKQGVKMSNREEINSRRDKDHHQKEKEMKMTCSLTNFLSFFGLKKDQRRGKASHFLFLFWCFRVVGVV